MRLPTSSFIRQSLLETTNERNKMKKIYIDMDGVLVNFDKWKLEDAKKHPEILSNDTALWRDAAKVERFYLNLEPMPDASKLIEYLKSLNIPLAILTGIPRRDTMPYAEQEKKEWMDTHFPGIEFNIGPYSKNKKNFSGPNLVLIDDRADNITDWNNAGGIGILYTTFEKTKQELEKLN